MEPEIWEQQLMPSPLSATKCLGPWEAPRLDDVAEGTGLACGLEVEH